MMTLNEYFEAKLELMAAGETCVLTREAIAELLKKFPAGARPTQRRPLPRLGTARLAEYFEKSVSTIRSWCAGGIFGDPVSIDSPYGYRVPQDRVEAVKARLDGGESIVKGKWFVPQSKAAAPAETPGPPAEDGSDQPGAGAGIGEAAAAETSSASPPEAEASVERDSAGSIQFTPAPPGSGKGKLAGWDGAKQGNAKVKKSA
jgi:hypothetical protein